MFGITILFSPTSSLACEQTFSGTIDTVLGGLLGVGLLAVIVLPIAYKFVVKPGMEPEGGLIPARFLARFYPAERWKIFATLRNYVLRSGFIPLVLAIAILAVGRTFAGPELKACSVFL